MVASAFSERTAEDQLVKVAYTGIAASGIDGKTCHIITCLSLNSNRPMSKETISKLRGIWRGKRYLIIDEFSMISKTLLARLSRNISIGMEENPSRFNDRSFGGLNVIIFGDLHQFPPVAVKKADVLYRPIDSAMDDINSQISRRTYEEFTKVVVLRKQNRVTDPEWKSLLRRLRMGEVTADDVTTVKGLVLTPQMMKTNEMLNPEWQDTCLVTPRHSVRRHWNEAALKQWCSRSGHRIFVCTAEDTLSAKRRASTAQILPNQGENSDRTMKTLPTTLQIAIGMKVMVTENLETNLDIANGARGHITAIVLHQHEPPVLEDSIIHLQHLPAYILVHLDKTKASRLPGLDQGVVPVEPRIVNMKFMVKENGQVVQRAGTRRQFPITPAYAFTDYRAQGQTIRRVIIDIARPPRGTLSLFNIYVALSRSFGRSTIRLLRDFDGSLLRQKHDLHLLAEDDRLNDLDNTTRMSWSRTASHGHMSLHR